MAHGFRPPFYVVIDQKAFTYVVKSGQQHSIMPMPVSGSSLSRIRRVKCGLKNGGSKISQLGSLGGFLVLVSSLI